MGPLRDISFWLEELPSFAPNAQRVLGRGWTFAPIIALAVTHGADRRADTTGELLGPVRVVRYDRQQPRRPLVARDRRVYSNTGWPDKLSSMTTSEFVKRKLSVVRALAEGQCGGSYADACILLASVVSALAADLWPGRRKDERRFAECWTKYADPTLHPHRVSVPLLVRALRRQNQDATADALAAARPQAFAPGHETHVLIGVQVDMSEAEVLQVCPALQPADIRRYSYGPVFYRHVRSALVHEYQLGDRASSVAMAGNNDGVSYTNRLSSSSTSSTGVVRQIHYPSSWLESVVESIGTQVSSSTTSKPLPDPTKWWLTGG